MYSTIAKALTEFQFYPANYTDDFILLVDSSKKISLTIDEYSKVAFGERNANNQLDGRGITIDR